MRACWKVTCQELACTETLCLVSWRKIPRWLSSTSLPEHLYIFDNVLHLDISQHFLSNTVAPHSGQSACLPENAGGCCRQNPSTLPWYIKYLTITCNVFAVFYSRQQFIVTDWTVTSCMACRKLQQVVRIPSCVCAHCVFPSVSVDSSHCETLLIA